MSVNKYADWRAGLEVAKKEKNKRAEFFRMGGLIKKMMKNWLWSRELRLAVAEKKLADPNALFQKMLSEGTFIIDRQFISTPYTKGEAAFLDQFTDATIVNNLLNATIVWDQSYFSTIDRHGYPIEADWAIKASTDGVKSISQEIEIDSAIIGSWHWSLVAVVLLVADASKERINPTCIITIRDKRV